MQSIVQICCFCTLVVFLASIVGCVSGRDDGLMPCSKGEFLSEEMARAEAIEQDKKEHVDQLDQWLRVVSMALDAGDSATARDVLIRVTDKFASLVSEKDFARSEKQALGLSGKEKGKYFLGDPYEQMMAFLYLGVLDFQAGEYELARASFRSASLADEGTALEGYKSDCYLAFLLEGIASTQLGDEAMADDAFNAARRAYAFRQNMPMLTEAFYKGFSIILAQAEDKNKSEYKKEYEKLDLLFPLCYGNLPAALSITTDHREALAAAFDGSRRDLDPENIRKIEGLDREEKKNSPALAFFKECRDQNEAIALVNWFEQCVTGALVPERLAQVAQAQNSFEGVVTKCADPQTNLFIVQMIGQGPSKIRRGKYGEEVSFYTHPDPVERYITALYPEGLDQQYVSSLASMTGESVDYQAKTRGGRQMDHVLKGRAHFRDAMNVSSAIASGVGTAATIAAVSAATTMVTTTTTTAYVTASGSVATTTTTTTSAAGMGAAAPMLAVAAGAIAVKILANVIADATHPEGDIRGWHELPRKLVLMSGTVEPGNYSLVSTGYDALGRASPTGDLYASFKVTPNKPNLLLCGVPWR